MSAITMSAALSTRVASIKRTSGAKAIKCLAHTISGSLEIILIDVYYFLGR